MSTISMRRRPLFLRFFALEAEPGGDPAPVEDPAPADPPATDPAPADPPADPAPVEGGETFSKEYVEKLRREAANYREKAKTDAAAAAEAARTEFAQSIGKAIGLVKDDAPADPAALVQQAETARDAAVTRERALTRELAVLKAADKHDANTTELLDSRDFARKLDALDPDADDFSPQVDELIKTAVDGNARFKRVQMTPNPGGAPHSGDGVSQLSREQLAAMSPEERLKAAKDGRLSALLNKH